VEQYQLADSRHPRRTELPIALPPGPGSIQWFTLDSSWATNTSILQLTVFTPTQHQPTPTLATTNFFLSVPPYQLQLTPGTLDITLTVVNVSTMGATDEHAVIMVSKPSYAVALFFTLTTLADGRFSHNCFHLYERETNVTFIPFGALDFNLLLHSLRWEHANHYLGDAQQQQQQQVVERSSQPTEVIVE